MAHSFLIFDFGGDEESAQKALRRIEGWKQGFRLDKKMQVKFERKDAESKAEEPAAPKAGKSGAKSKAKPGAKSKSGGGSADTKAAAEPAPSNIRLIVRLDFSDHEKLSHQRWVERIPTEEPFKAASPKIIRSGEADFDPTSDLFDSLD